MKSLFCEKNIFLIVVIKIIILFIISLKADNFIPYLGAFPYRSLLELYNLPRFIYSFANFDGVHYINIAKEGYHMYDQAFFPLYPLLIRFFSILFAKNHLIAGIFISNTALVLSCILMFRLLKKFLNEKKAFFFMLLFLSFPTSFYLSAVYSESLFLLFSVLSLYMWRKKKINGIIFGILSSFTRLVGFLNSILFFLVSQKDKIELRIIYIISPFIGLAGYMIYLYKSVNDPIFFLNAQPAFGASRSSNFILLPQVYYRYIKIFFTAQQNFQYWVAVMEFLFFNIVFMAIVFFMADSWKFCNKINLMIGIFSLLHLIIPSLTGTFSSIPRYSLFCFAFFFYILGRLSYKKILFVVLFSIMFQGILFVFFIQGYFIS